MGKKIKDINNLKKKLDLDILDSNIKYPIDDFDWKLINLIVNNGRMSNIEIAEKLKTSEATVRRRIDNLLKSGIIRGFATLLDYKKLGNTLKANIHLKVNSSSLDKVAEFLSKSKNSCGVYRVIGKYNLYTEIIFQNILSFQTYIDQISEMDDIEEFEYHIVTHAFKKCPWSGV
jgi:DNA-binding Lrp family transcriptional regulator